MASIVAEQFQNPPLADPAGRRGAVRELLNLAIPTVAQMASYTAMSFIDTWMLARFADARHSTIEPAAGANGGLLSFCVICFAIGLLTVVNTLVSQNFGEGNHRACGRYLWQGYWFAVLFYLAFLPLLPLVSSLFRSFGHEPALAHQEEIYLKILLAASLLKLVQTATAQFMLAINRPRAVLLATVVAVSVNAVAARLMIFGFGPIPAMGIRGAAWGQNIGVLVEMSLLLVMAMAPAVRRKFNALDWRFRWPQFRMLLSIGVGSGIQFISDLVGWTLFLLWVMARLGTDAMTANTYMVRYMSVSFMPALGMGTAVTALVGRYIGMGRPDIARRRAHLGFTMTAIYMISCGLVFFLGRHTLLRLFTDQPAVLSVGAVLMIFCAVYQFLDAMYIIYSSALRGAGDTFIPAISQAALCWGITVGGGYVVACWFPQLGVAGPWLAATFYGLLLGLFMVRRFARGDWMSRSLAEKIPTSDAPVPSNSPPTSVTVPNP